MSLIGRRRPTNHARLFGMYVTGACGDATNAANDLLYASTIAHEVGHMLNLGHRVEGVPETAPGAGDQRDMTAADPPASLVAGGIFWDGLLYPPHENVMQWWDPADIAQDFDILQALAVWENPLVNP